MKELAVAVQYENKTVSVLETIDAIKDAGFKNIELVEIIENEYYETEEDLLALLLKTPILDDFSEEDNEKFSHRKEIETNLFEQYVKEYKTDRGILLKRRLYGIVGKK